MSDHIIIQIETNIKIAEEKQNVLNSKHKCDLLRQFSIEWLVIPKIDLIIVSLINNIFRYHLFSFICLVMIYFVIIIDFSINGLRTGGKFKDFNVTTDSHHRTKLK